MFRELHEKEVAERELEQNMSEEMSRMTKAQVIHQIKMSKRDYTRNQQLLQAREEKVDNLECSIAQSSIGAISHEVLTEQLQDRERKLRTLTVLFLLLPLYESLSVVTFFTP